MCAVVFQASQIVTGVENTVGICRGQDENVWEGTDDESAVGSIQLQELLCQCGSRLLSHYRFHIQATVCPCVLCGSKWLPRGGDEKAERKTEAERG